MQERELARVLHISDLHIGDLDPKDNGALDSVAEGWWKLSRHFEGYLGHSGFALRHLDEAIAAQREAALREGGRDPILVVSGDLTAYGAETQFTLARQYLETGLLLRTGARTGLFLPPSARFDVPGNHDHWPGRRARFPVDLVSLGDPSGGFYRAFPTLPVPLKRVPLNGTCSLVIAGINTDADVGPNSGSRFLGRGSFLSQLEAVRGMMGPARTDEIRVLVMHHSPQHDGLKLGINRCSRRALANLVRECEISVILTGHLHEASGHVERVCSGGVSWNLYEARCGTTTQRDTLPLGWEQWQLPPNTFLVHRLVECAHHRIEWRTTVYQRMLRGFSDRGALTARGADSHPIAVWPRY